MMDALHHSHSNSPSPSPPPKHLKIFINWWRIQTHPKTTAKQKMQSCTLQNTVFMLNPRLFIRITRRTLARPPRKMNGPGFRKIWFRIISLWHYLKCSAEVINYRPTYLHFAINTDGSVAYMCWEGTARKRVIYAGAKGWDRREIWKKMDSGHKTIKLRIRCVGTVFLTVLLCIQ